MSQNHPPAELRQRYGTLSDLELKNLVRQTLEAPGKQADAILKQWLVALSFQTIRPPAKSNVSTIQHRQWVAFALRYLEPLTTNSSEPNTRMAVLDELNHAPADRLAILLFGAIEKAEQALVTFFQNAAELTSTSIPGWQKTAIDALRCPDYSEDVIKTWSRALIEPLISAAVEQLRPALSLVAQESVQLLTKRSDTPSAQYSVIFEHYLTLTSDTASKQHYGQALGYRNEYKRRMEIIAIYSRTTVWSFLLAVPLMIVSAFMAKGQPNGWLLPWVIGAGVVILFVGRLGNYLLDTFTWARTAQETLETLLGSQFQ